MKKQGDAEANFHFQNFLMTLNGHFFEKIELGNINWPRKNKTQILFLVFFSKKVPSS